jgi:lysophospholipid acyltransferase (LPLAT)-like uncharacterized protein
MTDAGASWRDSPAKRAQAALIPLVAWPIVEFVAASWSYRVRGGEHLERLRAAGQPHILALWHGRILEAMLALRDRGYVALISENFDGEWIARLSAHFGFDSVRGSSSRGGARAMAQSKRLLASGRNVFITVDGPRGPARKVQPGAVWLASVTGCPILPVRFEADRYRTAHSWDAHQIPSPGATITMVFDAPIYVGMDDERETLRLELESQLNAPVRL